MDDQNRNINTNQEYVGFNEKTMNTINSDGVIGNKIRNLSNDLLRHSSEFAEDESNQLGQKISNTAKKVVKNTEEFAEEAATQIKKTGKNIKELISDSLKTK